MTFDLMIVTLILLATIIAVCLAVTKGSWIIRCFLAVVLIAGSLFAYDTYLNTRSLPISGSPEGAMVVYDFEASEVLDFIYIWAAPVEEPFPPKTYLIPYSKEMHKGLYEGMSGKEGGKGKGEEGDKKGKAGKKGNGKFVGEFNKSDESKPTIKVILPKVEDNPPKD